jgi:pyrimidine-nucleoside phosphorylase
MNILEIIEKKRDKKELSSQEINFFVQEYTLEKIPDYQASALLMAIFLNGMSKQEIADLTNSMIHSGKIINFNHIPGAKIDKHSTGGVGDKTSLILAFVCAAIGLKVPMISGRSLGHTGGTLDKLESIPGFNVNLSLERYQEQIQKIGICLIGQTPEIAPADKKIYSLRDATATVPNKSLIASSIMSKKMAEGIDGLVMDVKTGKGAFMQKYEDSLELAQIMQDIGKALNKKMVSLITDMNQPLGMYVGNSLEIIECIQILQGKCLPQQEDIKELSFILAEHMLILGNLAKDHQEARKKIMEVIHNGKAFQKFKEVVKAQDGNTTSLDNLNLLPQAKHRHELKAEENGIIKELDALLIAKGCFYLGAGRVKKEDKIDHSVGCIVHKKVSDKVEKGNTLLEIHYNQEAKLKEALNYFQKAYSFSQTSVQKPSLIKKILY